MKKPPKNPISPDIRPEPSSFRDNRGFVFWIDGELNRQITEAGVPAYDAFMESGLYEELTEAGLLIRHKELQSYVLAPELVPVISYPYEWSFSQLKDAALATLDIQVKALAKGQTLRDASAYNIQFMNGKPCLIDTLSFEPYTEGAPWQAYRQFCQHFLAPLVLMSYRDPSLSQLLRVHIDGIPLPVAAGLLPLKAKLRPGIGVHVVAHARYQRQHQSSEARPARTVSRTSLLGLLDNLKRTIEGLKLPGASTEWGDYYAHTNYDDSAFKAKVDLVEQFVKRAAPKRVVDLGSNDGTFSRVAAKHADFVISADIDPVAVEYNYLKVRGEGEHNLLPLLIDLTNPSAGSGWDNAERSSFATRATSDLAMALALVHHLAISNNVPLEMIAATLAGYGRHLIIEFVPKEDSQVKRLLATREDIFPNYTKKGFEAAFTQHFRIVKQLPVTGSERTLYLMEITS